MKVTRTIHIHRPRQPQPAPARFLANRGRADFATLPKPYTALDRPENEPHHGKQLEKSRSTRQFLETCCSSHTKDCTYTKTVPNIRTYLSLRTKSQ